MAKAYSLIQAQTLTGSAASVTFSNIPQNYTDLIVKCSSRADADVVGVVCSINGSAFDSGRRFRGDGSSYAVSATNGDLYAVNNSGATASTFSNAEWYFPNYTSGNYKSVSGDGVTENNGTAAYSAIIVGIRNTTSAITTLSFAPTSGNFVANSTFYLYGIGGTRATGGTITADVNYTYHTFTSSGTFTALEKINNAEVLMVAGGGSGGSAAASNWGGGGGGAGGVAYASGQAFIAGTSYSAIVGAGGASATSAAGAQGSNSQLSSLTAAVGGGYGATTGAGLGNGGTGGSGGGAAYNSTTGTSGSVGSATSGQGYAGGSDGNGLGGGGGGAGAIGSNSAPNGGSTGYGGNGGAGTSAYHYWHLATNTGVSVNGNYFVAGGGGGAGNTNTGAQVAAGGIGGGGSGGYYATSMVGVAGTANTGGGGGGAGTGSASGAGGSGLVIIRYPNT